MPHTDLLALYFERSVALQWYWTLYAVILGGVLAFASIRKQPDTLTTALITVLFALFAWRNLSALAEASNQRQALHDAITQRASVSFNLPAADVSNFNALAATLRPAPTRTVYAVHLTADALTILALWAMELRRRRAAPL